MMQADVYSFMQFPGSWLNRGITIKLKDSRPDFINNFLFASETASVCNIDLLKKLVNNYCEKCSDKSVMLLFCDSSSFFILGSDQLILYLFETCFFCPVREYNSLYCSYSSC